jgi:alpha-N-arabinofuranosidase
MLVAFLVLLALAPGINTPAIANGGFEAPEVTANWVVKTPQSGVVIRADTSAVKEGRQSLLVSAAQPASVSLEQHVFLPVGTLWRLSTSIKINAAAVSGKLPTIVVDTPSGQQGTATPRANNLEWQTVDVLFRVPSPGKVKVSLVPFAEAAGKVWFDDIRLNPEPESITAVEQVEILSSRLQKRPIDLKQGGQFIEPLCNLLPSMISQQVASTSFEEESPWKVEFKSAIDKPFRPWYPDGAVQDATYSRDTNHPFNGKVSERIDLPLANVWAGISQDGFYIENGHSYRLSLHLRSEGPIQTRASLHGGGHIIAGPVSLGQGSTSWISAEAVLRATSPGANGTLTIECTGPGTLWLDRIYLIDENAVLRIWRPDVVAALKELNPGIIRFGGSELEYFDWEKVLGTWDKRPVSANEAWGGVNENFIGVEEFVQLCRYIGAEPLICIRWTNKTPDDAAAEVEYFNGGPNTKWGALRVRNGHRDPYGVKYWQIGNEIGANDYDASLKPFADAIRRVDPGVKLLSSFPNSRTLRSDGGTLDYICPHDYSIGDLAANQQEFDDLGKMILLDANGRDVRVGVTEWNTTAGAWALGRGMLLTLGNALGCSRYQNLLHRYSDLVEIANRSNLTDSFGSGILEPGPGWLYLAPTYYAQKLYQRAAGSYPLQIQRSNRLGRYLAEPDLDATLTGEGDTLRLYGVNSTGSDRTVRFDLDKTLGVIRSGEKFVLHDTAAKPESEAMNTRDAPQRVAVTSESVSASGHIITLMVEPFSLTLLELKLDRQ